MTNITAKMKDLFNRTSRLDKIDVANRVAVDGITAVATGVLAGTAMAVFGVATSPVSIPLALAAAAVGGVIAHKRTFPKA